MEKELWDDSVLINAFNSAISKYKNMHGVASKRASGTTKSRGVLADVNGQLANVALESKSDVPETLSEISPEKEELDHVEGPSKEESQMHPGTAAENSGISQETFPDQSLEWVEYERQQITYQLSQLAEQREKLEQQLNHLGSGSMEQPTTAGTYNNYYGGWESQYQYSYPYTSETCYQCRWNGYYNSAYWQTSAADHLSHELQCQHCGYMNKRSESISKASESVPNEPSNPSPQLFTGTSSLPEMVAHAVSEALKSAGVEQNSKHTSFSDVAAAWFLAGFQTSRYLLQEGLHQPER